LNGFFKSGIFSRFFILNIQISLDKEASKFQFSAAKINGAQR